MPPKLIRIGTRASQLALWQANWVKSELENRYPGMEVTLTKIKTMGDKILDVPLAQVGGKGLFVKEIEEAMLRGEIDIAVHSMKDVPTDFPEGLGLYCITKREDPRDAMISRGVQFADLPQGARIGTSALRRQAQLLKERPDLQMVVIRFQEQVTEYMSVLFSVPAIGQGALGIECRLDDEEIKRTIEFFNDPDTSFAVRAERALLKRCEGGCQVPIAAHGTVNGEELDLVGFIAAVDGSRSVKGKIVGHVDQCEQLGILLAESLLQQGGKEMLEEVYRREIHA
jgi:hydroxymethylbilane synthase